MIRKNAELSEMPFVDDKHKEKYVTIMHLMKSNNPEHAALAYLIALINAPIHSCFDFENDQAKLDAVDCSWVTGSSERVLKLAFNLWNFLNFADVSDVFSYGASEYGEYMFFAIQMRFELVIYHRVK